MVVESSNLAAASGVPDFTREVRPLLSRHCFKCHGPDDAARKGGLRLDVRESALRPARSGTIALVPGNIGDSELVKRIQATDEDEVMPPPSTKGVLTAAEKDILKRWVAAGGEYRQHWAFLPPVAPKPPSVRRKSWARNPIDQFVLARLESERLAPSAPADRYKLVRRVYLDLIGLPPTPEEADAFVKDRSSGAYEKVVDHLLDSPQYGERWARRWMDLARYADTNGYEKDRRRSIWPWRDWVVRALNDDMPFDRFTIEQIAGDMLPDATTDQFIATGFHRNTMLNEEGGIDPLEFRFHAMTDRVATTGAAWLGLTVGCAQCHTHKYDPIPHKEYYQLMAFMNNADEPDLDLPRPGWEMEHRANLEKASTLLARLEERFPIETGQWSTPKPVSAQATSGEVGKVLDDGSALFGGTSPDKDSYTFVLDTDLTTIQSLRIEALIDEALPSKGPGRTGHGNFVLSEVTITAAPRNAPQETRAVRIGSAKADVEQGGFPVLHAFDGKPETGWGVDAEGGKLNANHAATFFFEEAVGFPAGTRLVVRIDQALGGRHTIGRPRLSLGVPVQDQRPPEVRRKELVDVRFEDWLARERRRAVPWTALKPVGAKSNLPLLAVQPDDSVFASGDISKSDTYDLEFRPGPGGITALRLEALPDDRLPRHGPGLAYYEGPKGDFFMGEFQILADGVPLKIASATESHARNNFGGSASARLATDGDPQTGWSTAGREGERHEAVFVLETPLVDPGTLQVRMLFGRHYACPLGRFRISATSQTGGVEANGLDAGLVQLLRIPDAELTAAQRETLREGFLLNAPELEGTRKEIEQLRRPPTHTTTLVMRERPAENPRPTFIHRRGEFLQPTDRVEPAVLSALSPLPGSFARNRLGFARWLVSRENPLTARVTVNRQWQAFFGIGLVRTTEDFGYQGEAPSHPELLDWLAVEFMDQGWSMKKLHKRIVMSATYQQSSRATPQLLAKDPENRLLARGPGLRLDAEVIRDVALSASGLLSAKMGGPSVHPPQPAGVTEAAYGGSGWPTSTGEDRHRRSLYTFMQRTAPFAMFNTFDAPTGESCVARRDVSNTPLQALTLLNDVAFVEVTQALGRRLAAQTAPVEDRVRHAFRRCLTRPPTREEVATLVRFLEAQERRIAQGELDAKRIAGEGEGDPVQCAAWTTLVRAIMNLDEMITKG